MFLLRMENAHLSDGDRILDRFQYVTTTVDPAGTHVETYYPAKWFYNGEGAHTARDVADLPTRTLVNDASVLDIKELDRPVGPGDLTQTAGHLRDGDGVIFRSGLNRQWEDPGLGRSNGLGNAYSQKTGITPEATRWLTDRKIRLCAIDFRTPEDPSYKWELPSHKQLHVNDVLIIEDIAHLDRLREERLLLLVGAPIKGRHLTGGPARVVGIEGWGRPDLRIIDLSHIMGPYPAPAAGGRSRRVPPEESAMALNRADFMFFDIGQTGLSDLVGPQYLRVSSRAGTHLLNPVGPGAQPLFEDMAAISANRLVGPAVAIELADIGACDPIGASSLAPDLSRVREGDWVVLRTGHTDWYERRFPEAERWSPKLTPEGIEAIARTGARGIICDIAAPAAIGDRRDVETALFENGLLLVANARRLWMLRHERFFAAVLPLPVRGLVHSPAHVFLIEDWNDGSWI